MGDIKPEEAATNIVSGFINLTSPLKAEASTGLPDTLTKAAPDIAQPFADIGANRTTFGSPIYIEPKFKAGPLSELGREDTGEGWKVIARGLSKATGGTRLDGGWLDEQPEVYRYLVEQYLGGLYSFPRDITKAVFNEPRPNETFAQRVPIIKTFFGKGGNYVPMNKFYKYTTKKFGVDRQPDMEGLYSQYLNTDTDSPEWKEERKAFPLETDEELLRQYGDTRAMVREINRYWREGGYGDNRKEYLEALNSAYNEFNQMYVKKKAKYRGK
jgi:hypothetical protein